MKNSNNYINLLEYCIKNNIILSTFDLDYFKENIDYSIEKYNSIEEAYNYLIESRDPSIDEISSRLTGAFGHLLKYQYQPEKQSKSWIYSINRDIDEFNVAISNNKNKRNKATSDQFFDEAYKRAIKEIAIKDTKDYNERKIEFPKERPYEYNLQLITDRNSIKKFLMDNFNRDKNRTGYIETKKAIEIYFKFDVLSGEDL